jgi:hypothetical protein
VHKKKIIKILETFTEEEWRACHKYLKFCNKKDSKGLQLYSYIFNNRQDLTSSNLSDEAVRKKVLKNCTDRAFLNILSDLVKDIEAFMVHYYMHSSEGSYEHKWRLAQIFKSKGLYNYFQRTWKEVDQELESRPTMSLFHNLKKLEMNHALYFSDVYAKNSKPVDFLVEAEKNRVNFSENLKTFYDTEFYNLKSLVKVEVETSHDSTFNPISEIVSNLNLLITKREKKSFEFLENQLYANEKSISDDLKKGIILALINYCIHRIRLGDLNMKDNMAKLTLFGLEQGIYLSNNRISENTFLNIIDTLSHSNLKIAHEEFISKWIHKVNTSDPISLKNMAYAMWAFANHQYDKTIQILNASEIHTTRLNLSLRARWMMLCSLCSLYEDYQEKNQILKSSKSFFKRFRHRMNPSTYTGSINLVNVVNLIWNGASQHEINVFIQHCEVLTMRSWVDYMIHKKTRQDALSLGL